VSASELLLPVIKRRPIGEAQSLIAQRRLNWADLPRKDSFSARSAAPLKEWQRNHLALRLLSGFLELLLDTAGHAGGRLE